MTNFVKSRRVRVSPYEVFIVKNIIRTYPNLLTFLISTFIYLLGVFTVLNLVDYLNTIMLYQYTDFVLLLRQRYIWLNREITTLGEIVSPSTDGLTGAPLYPNEFITIKRPPFENNSNSGAGHALQALANIHDALYDCAEVGNRAYSIQLLATVGVRFLMVTTQLLNTYKMLADGKSGSTVSFVLAGIYIILHTLKVFMFASLSSNTADKAQQTALRLHRIWEANSDFKQNVIFLKNIS